MQGVLIGGLYRMALRQLDGLPIRYLTHPDPDVRSAAAEAMLLSGNSTFRKHLSLAFGDLKSRGGRYKLRGLDSLGTFASKVPELRPQLIEAVMEALGDPDRYVRRAALERLRSPPAHR